MAKRFTDTEIWNKKWFRELPVKMKEAWRYLTENCNYGGVWDVDMARMSFGVGVKITESEIKQHLGDKIQVLEDGIKWYIPDFCPFQYGELNPNVSTHKGAIKIHKKYNLANFYNLHQNKKIIQICWLDLLVHRVVERI